MWNSIVSVPNTGFISSITRVEERIQKVSNQMGSKLSHRLNGEDVIRRIVP